MTPSCLIGVDAGTREVRAAAFAMDGRLLALARRPTPTIRPRPGWADVDADALWAATAAALTEVTTVLPPGTEIASVASATVGEAGLPIDAHGRPLRPIIAWFDTRAVAYARHWEDTVGGPRVYALSGMTIDGLFGANKIMWVRDHEPHIWSRAAAWLSTEDWLILKLTGAPATSHSVAARTMLFDRTRLAWSPELLEAAGLEARLMPPAGPSGTTAGQVSRVAAAETGLQAGTPVVLGGHDHICATFVAGGGEGTPVDSTGTAEALVTSVASAPAGDPGLAAHVNCYPDVVPGRMVLLASVGLAGGLVDWLRREVWKWPAAEADAYSRMFAEVRSPVRPNGVMCFPQFGRGASPRFDPERARGAFVGLTAGHSRGDLLQAALEASCFSLRHNLDWVAEHLGKSAPRVRVLGGAVNLPLWLQLKATITGREVEAAAVGEPAALGAAVLGGVGAGVYADHRAGAAAVASCCRGGGLCVGPDPELVEAYRALYEDVWRRLPDQLGPLAAGLPLPDAWGGGG
jgi:xylulokinase